MESTIPGTDYEQIPRAIVLDGFAQFFLLGVILCQVVRYFEQQPKQGIKKEKYFVGVLVTLSAIQTGVEGYKVWRTSINLERWSTSRIQWADFTINGGICTLGQAFFIRRCWMLSRRKWAVAPLVLLWLCVVGADTYLAVRLITEPRDDTFLDHSKTESRYLMPESAGAFSAWVIGSIVLDVFVAATLSWTLASRRSGIGSDNMVVNIIRLTWTAAILPPIPLIIALTLYHLPEELNSHFVVMCALLTGKLYVVGVLYSVNARQKLRQSIAVVHSGIGRTDLSEWSNASLIGTAPRAPTGTGTGTVQASRQSFPQPPSSRRMNTAEAFATFSFDHPPSTPPPTFRPDVGGDSAPVLRGFKPQPHLQPDTPLPHKPSLQPHLEGHSKFDSGGVGSLERGGGGGGGGASLIPGPSTQAPATPDGLRRSSATIINPPGYVPPPLSPLGMCYENYEGEGRCLIGNCIQAAGSHSGVLYTGGVVAQNADEEARLGGPESVRDSGNFDPDRAAAAPVRVEHHWSASSDCSAIQGMDRSAGDRSGRSSRSGSGSVPSLLTRFPVSMPMPDAVAEGDSGGVGVFGACTRAGTVGEAQYDGVYDKRDVSWDTESILGTSQGSIGGFGGNSSSNSSGGGGSSSGDSSHAQAGPEESDSSHLDQVIASGSTSSGLHSVHGSRGGGLNDEINGIWARAAV